MSTDPQRSTAVQAPDPATGPQTGARQTNGPQTGGPPHPPPGPHAPHAPLGPLWTAGLLRFLLTAQAAMIVAQPILIGQYLDGDFNQLSAHSLNGAMLPGVTLLCLGAALCHWLLGRGRSWPVLATAALIPLEVTQLAAGYSRSLGVHIPLGTAVVAMSLFLAGWSWTRRARSARPRKTVRAERTPGRPA